MSKEHAIHTVIDMLALTEEEFGRMLPDLTEWYFFGKFAEASGGEVTGFTWVDDGRPGEVFSIEGTDPETGKRYVADSEGVRYVP